MAHESGSRKRAGHIALEEGIAQWRSYLTRRSAASAAEVDELERRLRSQAGALMAAGLAEDEALLVALVRMGEFHAPSREFVREHGGLLWKRLVVAGASRGGVGEIGREAWLVLALAVAAGVAVKVPELFGIAMRLGEELPSFYLRNASLFVLPFLTAYFAWKRAMPWVSCLWLGAVFVAGATLINAMPWRAPSHTEMLAALHLPIALWLLVGAAHAGGRWRDPRARMNYLRFSGEWFVYYVLIALGGGVLLALGAFLFNAIGVRPEPFLVTWVLPCGAAGAVLVAAWLVEARQSVVESMAPVLTRVFTPLFSILLVTFLAAIAWVGRGLAGQRDLLIGFDLLLVVVVGLVLYAVSARDPGRPPGFFDALQLVLVVSAVLVDAVALWAVSARIAEFGASPNKVAALGENLVLLGSLGGSAVLYARFLGGRAVFAPLERWQTVYLPVYAVWAWMVVALFPPLFGFA